jgi:hypothetical protein
MHRQCIHRMFILLYLLHSVIPINADEEVNPLKIVFAVTTTSAPILFSRNECEKNLFASIFFVQPAT